MAKHRKDQNGRTLREGESQRNDNHMYIYTYRDPMGTRRYIYAKDIVKLREKERELQKNQLDGLDVYAMGKATINYVFDRYLSLKRNLRENTKQNYIYLYDHYIRKDFETRKIADVTYSDVFKFYLYLLEEKKLSRNTIENIQNLLHPTFDMAVRDDIIRKNPTNGLLSEFTKSAGVQKRVRHALTPDQQEAFMGYIADHPVYCHWWPVFTVLLGTGTRVSECLGLTWKDVDFENGKISINHSLINCGRHTESLSYCYISKPKTEAGIRDIPMLDVVRDAFEMIREDQKSRLIPDFEIDGYHDFVFINREGSVLTPASLNNAIKRITADYNAEEEIEAKREGRIALMLPHFSCHHLRHTFASRLCEAETNLKVIQSIMGHKDIETTMDVYAECTERQKKETFETLAAKLDKLF